MQAVNLDTEQRGYSSFSYPLVSHRADLGVFDSIVDRYSSGPSYFDTYAYDIPDTRSYGRDDSYPYADVDYQNERFGRGLFNDIYDTYTRRYDSLAGPEIIEEPIIIEEEFFEEPTVIQHLDSGIPFLPEGGFPVEAFLTEERYDEDFRVVEPINQSLIPGREVYVVGQPPERDNLDHDLGKLKLLRHNAHVSRLSDSSYRDQFGKGTDPYLEDKTLALESELANLNGLRGQPNYAPTTVRRAGPSLNDIVFDGDNFGTSFGRN